MKGVVAALMVCLLVFAVGGASHYEGVYVCPGAMEVAAGEWAAPPLTVRLPEGLGYTSITEAALRDYAGMTLQTDGKGGFRERLGHSPPASYPYRLRYGDENAMRLSAPAALRDTIIKPFSPRVEDAVAPARAGSQAISRRSS